MKWRKEMVRIILPYQEREQQEQLLIRRGQPELDLTHAVQLYPRVSTKEQMQNVSAEMQQDISFCLNYGWPRNRIVMDAADLGKSGQLRMDEREAFIGMLERIRKSIVKTVVAAQVDRFFREKWGVEYGKFMQICCEYNVKVVTLTHNRRNIDFIYDFSISWHIDQFRRECEAAWGYIEKHIGRMHGARDELQNAGIWCCGSIAAGYLPDFREIINGRKNPDYYRYLPHEAHGQRIHWMTRRFRELAANTNTLFQEIQHIPLFLPAFPPEIAALPFISRYSPTKVLAQDILDENGKPVVLGYTYSSIGGLKSALTNPVNIGHWIVGNQIVRYNNHLPIVDEGDFMYALEHLSPTNLDGTTNPYFEKKKNYYMKRHFSTSPAILQNHIEALDPDFSVRPRTYPRKGEHLGETETCYGLVSRNSSCRVIKYLIPTSEIDGFFFYLLKRRLEEAREFEDYSDSEKKEKEEQTKSLGQLDMQISACERAMKKLLKRLVQLKKIEEEESADQEEEEKKENALVKAINDEYNLFNEDRTNLIRRRELLARQSTQTAQRQTYKELILKVKKYWPDNDIYPPEDLIPLDELPMIVETFVERVVLDTLSPHFYQITIYWRDPVWGADNLICYRGVNPCIQWSDEENSLLRQHYPTTTRDEIMRLLPDRTYNSIQSRASIFRIPKRRTFNTENMPYSLSLRDYEVMGELGNVTEDDLLNGDTFVEIAGAKLVNLCRSL
jgi:hypothetical protein